MEIFPVHTLILTIHSPVLGHMIQTRKSHELELSESPETARVFGSFIRYLYSGEIVVSLDTAVAFHRLACKYNVSALKRGLSEHMALSLASNWPHGLVTSWLEYAVQMGELWLRDRCMEAMALNLRALLEDGDFLSLSPDLFLALLPRSDLVLNSELDLFIAVQAWIQTNEPDGLTAENALRAVRYAMISPQELFRIQTESPVLSRYQDSVRDLLYLSFQFHSGSAWTMSRFLDLNCSLFLPRVYLNADWGRSWSVPGPIREDRSLTMQTLLGPSGLDRNKRVLWNVLLSPQRRPLSVALGPEAGPQTNPGPWVTVSPASAGPDLTGIVFQKSLLVVRGKNSRICSFHHSSSESPGCLQTQDLLEDLMLHVVLRPLYTTMD